MDAIIAYFENDFLNDFEAFKAEYTGFDKGLTEAKVINDFVAFLKTKQPAKPVEDNPGVSSLRPDQQPTPNIVDYDKPLPPDQQPKPTIVDYGTVPPAQQPIPEHIDKE